MLDGSERLERIMSLALTARERSDVTMFEAYVQLMNANYWLDRTSQSLDRDWNRVLRRVSRVLEDSVRLRRHGAFRRAACAATRPSSTTCSSSGSCARGWSSADALTRLHTLRLALIHFVYLKAMEIPQFSSRLEMSLDELDRAALLSRRAGHASTTLRGIFPAAEPADDTEVYAERDTYVGTAPSGYAAEHAADLRSDRARLRAHARAQRADRAARRRVRLTRSYSGVLIVESHSLNRGATGSTSE